MEYTIFFTPDIISVYKYDPATNGSRATKILDTIRDNIIY